MEKPGCRAGRRRRAQLVFFELAAQGVAVDAEHLRGSGLVAVGAAQHAGEQRALDRVHDHGVERTGRLAVEVGKVAVEHLFDGALDVVGTHAAASAGS